MAPVLDRIAGIVGFAAIFLGIGLSLADTEKAEPATEPDVRFEVQIENRKVVGNQLIRVTEGQVVEMIWTTDEETQVHIHGYEIHIPTSPDAPARITFEAHATGRFPVTSHGYGSDYGKMHYMLLYFEVHPK
jgi:hypothetical protein